MKVVTNGSSHNSEPSPMGALLGLGLASLLAVLSPTADAGRPLVMKFVSTSNGTTLHNYRLTQGLIEIADCDDAIVSNDSRGFDAIHIAYRWRAGPAPWGTGATTTPGAGSAVGPNFSCNDEETLPQCHRRQLGGKRVGDLRQQGLLRNATYAGDRPMPRPGAAGVTGTYSVALYYSVGGVQIPSTDCVVRSVTTPEPVPACTASLDNNLFAHGSNLIMQGLQRSVKNNKLSIACNVHTDTRLSLVGGPTLPVDKKGVKASLNFDGVPGEISLKVPLNRVVNVDSVVEWDHASEPGAFNASGVIQLDIE